MTPLAPLGLFAFAPTAGGDYESIATITVGSGGASSVLFSSIPQTYKHLRVYGLARDSRGGYTWSALYGKVNGDTGANYTRHGFIGDGGTLGIYAASGDGGASYGMCAGASAASGLFAPSIIDFIDYSNTNKAKTVKYMNGMVGPYTYFGSYLWNSTSAITSIEFYPLSPNFVEGTNFQLYGLKG